MASLSEKDKSIRKSELSVRVTKLSSDWQFARALLEHEYECIDKHQIGSRYEFAKHLLDIHRMWCAACTHSACPDLPVRSNQDPAGSAAAQRSQLQVQKRIYVSSSTQTIDAEMERMNQITVLPVHVLLKEEESTEEHCEEGISNQHVRSDLQTHIESTNQDSDLLVKQEEPCQEPCNVEMESSRNQSAPHKGDEKGIITQQIKPGKLWRRTRHCEICFTPTNDMSKHLERVHKLSKEERQTYMLAARSRVPITRRSTNPSDGKQLKRQDCPICPGKHYTRLGDHLKFKHGLNKDQVVEIRKRMKQERKAALKMKINNGFSRSTSNTGEHGPKSSQVHYYKGKQFRRTRLCEICSTSTNDMSKHLITVHKLSKEERQPYILAARSRVPITRRSTIPSCATQLKRQDCPICPGKHYTRIDNHLKKKHGLDKGQVVEIRKRMKQERKAALKMKINNGFSRSPNNTGEHGPKSSQVHYYKGKHWRRTRICEICFTPTNDMSKHLERVHKLSKEERQPYIMAARSRVPITRRTTIPSCATQPKRQDCPICPGKHYTRIDNHLKKKHGLDKDEVVGILKRMKQEWKSGSERKNGEPSSSTNVTAEHCPETPPANCDPGKDFRRTRLCEICSVSTNKMSKHLERVHKLSKEERQPYILAARSRVPITRRGTIYDPSCAEQRKRQDCPICPGKNYTKIRQHLLGKHGLKKDEVVQILKGMKQDTCRKTNLEKNSEGNRSTNHIDAECSHGTSSLAVAEERFSLERKNSEPSGSTPVTDGPEATSQTNCDAGKDFRRTRLCEICAASTNHMSQHLQRVHKLSKEERQTYILAARSRVPITRRGTIYDPSSAEQRRRQDCPICPGKKYTKIRQHLLGKHGLNNDEVIGILKKMKQDKKTSLEKNSEPNGSTHDTDECSQETSSQAQCPTDGKSILENNSDPSSSTQDADEHGPETPSQASCDPDWATIMELLDLETVLDTNDGPSRSNCKTEEHGPEASTQPECESDGKTTFQEIGEPSKSSNDSDEQPIESSFHDNYYTGKNFRRTRPCEICSASTNDMSKHLARVHKLSKEERQTYMLAARSRVPITKHGTIYDPSCAKQPKRQDCPICPGKHYANIRQHLLGKHGLKKDEVAEIWKKMKKDRKSVLQNKRELRRSTNNTDERGPDASSQAQSQETDAVAKPYLCSICGKSFKQEWHLSSHIQTHTGEKPFLCSVCAKRYDRKGNLIIHMRTHTGEKPYLCATCGKSFARKGSFNLHMRMHTREKPFLCPICNMRFTRGGNMKRHMRTHRQETPYKCPLCNKGFPFKISLSIHIRKHTEEKPD